MAIIPPIFRRFVAVAGGSLALLGLGAFLTLQVFAVTPPADKRMAVRRNQNGPLPYVFKQEVVPGRLESDIVALNLKYLLEEYTAKASDMSASFDGAAKSFSYPLNFIPPKMEETLEVLSQMDGVIVYGSTLDDSADHAELLNLASLYVNDQRFRIQEYRGMIDRWKSDLSLALTEKQKQLSALKTKQMKNELQVGSDLAGEIQLKLKGVSLRMGE